MTDAELIRILRCSASVHTENINCEGCPAFVIKPVPEEYKGKVPEDLFSFCDVAAISRMTADLLGDLEHIALAPGVYAELKKLMKRFDDNRLPDSGGGVWVDAGQVDLAEMVLPREVAERALKEEQAA